MVKNLAEHKNLEICELCKALFNSIGLIFIWILVLQINGFQQWTNKSKLQSMGIILVPQILWFSLILFITYLVR